MCIASYSFLCINESTEARKPLSLCRSFPLALLASLQGFNGQCLTFMDMVHQGVESRCCLMVYAAAHCGRHILLPTGLEILVYHGSTDAQLWNAEHAWYNGRFYKSPEELPQEYEDECVNVVVPGNPLPMSREQSPASTAPRVLQCG